MSASSFGDPTRVTPVRAAPRIEPVAHRRRPRPRRGHRPRRGRHRRAGAPAATQPAPRGSAPRGRRRRAGRPPPPRSAGRPAANASRSHGPTSAPSPVSTRVETPTPRECSAASTLAVTGAESLTRPTAPARACRRNRARSRPVAGSVLTRPRLPGPSTRMPASRQRRRSPATSATAPAAPAVWTASDIPGRGGVPRTARAPAPASTQLRAAAISSPGATATTARSTGPMAAPGRSPSGACGLARPEPGNRTHRRPGAGAGPAQAPQQLLGDVAAMAGGAQHGHRARPQQPLHRRGGSRRLPGGQGRLEGGGLRQVHGDTQRVAVPLGPQRQPQVVEDLEHLDVAAQHQRHQLVQAPGPCPGDQVLQQQRAQAVPLGHVVDHQGHLGRRRAHLVAGPHAHDQPPGGGRGPRRASARGRAGSRRTPRRRPGTRTGTAGTPYARTSARTAPGGGEVVRADHAHLQHGAVGGEDVVPGRDLLHPATVGGPRVHRSGPEVPARSREGAAAGTKCPVGERARERTLGCYRAVATYRRAAGSARGQGRSNDEHHSREQHRRGRRRIRVQ